MGFGGATKNRAKLSKCSVVSTPRLQETGGRSLQRPEGGFCLERSRGLLSRDRAYEKRVSFGKETWLLSTCCVSKR